LIEAKQTFPTSTFVVFVTITHDTLPIFRFFTTLVYSVPPNLLDTTFSRFARAFRGTSSFDLDAQPPPRSTEHNHNHTNTSSTFISTCYGITLLTAWIGRISLSNRLLVGHQVP
jgi:hypothetical protein